LDGEELALIVHVVWTGQNIDDRQWQLMNQIRTNVGTPHISKRALLKIDRQLYNSVKHYDIDGSETLHINRRYEAFPMLYHTFNLALYLDINFKNKAKFKNISRKTSSLIRQRFDGNRHYPR